MKEDTYQFDLQELGLLEKIGKDSFDNLTQLASSVLDVPISLVSIIDIPNRRQYFKSIHGQLRAPYQADRETPLTHSFCKHVVADNAPLCVENAPQHPLVRTNGAIKDLGVMAYLGVPIHDPQMRPIGALCAISGTPRVWSQQDQAFLIALSKCVDDAIRLRAAILSTEKEREITSARDLIIFELKHRLSNIFASIQSMIRLSKKNYQQVSEFAEDLSGRVVALSNAHSASLNGRSTDRFCLLDLVNDTLLPYADAGFGLALDVSDVRLESRYATPLGLILHELATNAIKHGAWARSGHVDVQIMPIAGSCGPTTVAFVWTERVRDGLQKRADERIEGFGTKLINLSFQQMSADYRRTWLPEGLELRFEIESSVSAETRVQAA